MKKIVRILLLLLCSTGIYAQVYVVEDTVYYNNKAIEGADVTSFEVIMKHPFFSKDKFFIYYKGKKTKFDAESFKIHGDSDTNDFIKYYSDKNDIYLLQKSKKLFGSKSKNKQILPLFKSIKSKSPENFKFISDDIAIDSETIYWDFKPMLDSDPTSIKIINNFYYKDKKRVYHTSFRTPIDPKELKIINADIPHLDTPFLLFIYDQNTICNMNNNCYKMDMKSFKYINYGYAKDKNRVLSEMYLKADAETFKVPIPKIKYYAEDKFHQYYSNDVFPIKVDKKYLTEERIESHVKWIDKQLKAAFLKEEVPQKYDKDTKSSLSILYTFPNSNNTIIEKGKYIYMNGTRQPLIDAATFEILNNDYAKDKNNVYLINEYKNDVSFKSIYGIDSSTFSIIKNSFKMPLCKDAKNVYYCDNPIGNVNPNTLRVLNKHFVQDENTIYYVNCSMLSGISIPIKPEKGAQLVHLGGHYYSYQSYVFYRDYDFYNLVQDPILSNIKIINTNYAINGKQIVYKGKTIGVLAIGETIVKNDENRIITSKNQVFIDGKNNIMKEKRFKIFYKYGGSKYTTEGHKIYFKNVEIEGVVLDDFLYRTGSYTIFKNNKAIYYSTVLDIDTKTFEKHSHAYAKDKNFVYYYGKKTRLDPETFYCHGRTRYASDKYGVYFDNILIPKADTKSFYSFNFYGFDNTYFYFLGRKILRSEVNLKG